jgi:hypothetical protein
MKIKPNNVMGLKLLLCVLMLGLSLVLALNAPDLASKQANVENPTDHFNAAR